MPTDDFISCDFPNLDAFIKQLDLMNANVNRALRNSLKHCGKMIAGSQKRKIRYKSKRLADAIGEGEIFITENGALGIKVGYQPWTFDVDYEDVDYENDVSTKIGVIGMVFEFGRPGQSAERSSLTTYRHLNGSKSGFLVKKGAIQPIPHIRSGFDEIKPYCVNIVIEAYNREIDKLSE